MSIALTQKVKALEELVKELTTRLERLESVYNDQHTPVNTDLPKRRGRPPKHENA